MPNKTDETNKRGADNHWGGETSISSILEVRRKIRCCCYVCVMYVYYTLCKMLLLCLCYVCVVHIVLDVVVMFVLCLCITHCVHQLQIPIHLPPSTGSHLLSPFALNQLIKAVSNAPLPDGMLFVAFLKIRRTYTPEKSIELWRNFLPTKQR